MRRRRLILVALLLVAALGAATALAAGDPRATSTATLSDNIGLGGWGYGLSTDAAGAATAIWSGPQDTTLEVRAQDAHGGWGATEQIAAGQIDAAQLVEAPNGAAVVVWIGEDAAGDPRIDAVSRASSGAPWSAVQTVSTGPAADGSSEFGVVIDDSGTATVAWTGPAPDHDATSSAAALFSAQLQAGASGPAASATPLTGAVPDPTNLSLAGNGAGATLLSWQTQQIVPSRHGRVARVAEMAALRPAGGVWGRPARLDSFSFLANFGAGGNVWEPTAPTSVVTPNGAAALAWRDGGPAAAAPALMVSGRAAGADHWQAPRTLSRPVDGFGLVDGPANTIVAAYTIMTRTGGSDLFSQVLKGVGHWTPPTVALRARGGFGLFDLTSNRGGEIAFTPELGNVTAVTAARRGTDGHWSALSVAGTGEEAEIALGDRGTFTVAWEAFRQRGQLTWGLLQAREFG